jgi:hypothetical protein
MAEYDVKPTDKESKHAEIIKNIELDAEADWQNRLDAIDDLRFVANENGNGQWDPLVWRERFDQGRPIITVNLMPQFIRQVTNDARKNRPAIKVRPVDDDADPKTADVFEGIVRHIEDQSEAASKAYIPAIDNAAKCGIGNWRVTAKYCDGESFDEKQELYIEGIPNALAVLWDRAAKDPTRMDANHVSVLDDMTDDAFKAKYPDAALSDISLGNNGSLDWRTQDMVRVVEYWCKEPTDRVLAKTEDGSILDITKVPKDALQFLPPHKTKKVKGHKICQYIVSGKEILEGPNEWKGKYLPIIPIIGDETYVGDNRIRSSLVRHAKDPARLYNLWRSNQAEVIGLQPKSPFIATFKQIEKYKALWNQANRRNLPYLPYDADPQANGPPKREQPPVASQAMAEEIAIAAGELRSTTGIYDSGLGQHTSEAVSGKAIGKLQQQSDMATLHFGDNLQLSIRHCGRVLVDLIPYYWDTEQTVRLLNEDGSDKFEKINSYIMTQGGPEPVHDLSIGTYDVTVTAGPSYATKRMESVDVLTQLISTMPDAAMFMMDILVKNMDIPGGDELAKRFKMAILKAHPEFADKDDQQDMPQPTQGDQMNAMMGQLEVKQKEAETREAEANADVAEMGAATAAVELDAMSQTHHAMTEAVVLKTLQDIITRGQQAMQPAQPGQPPQPAAPAGA